MLDTTGGTLLKGLRRILGGALLLVGGLFPSQSSGQIDERLGPERFIQRLEEEALEDRRSAVGWARQRNLPERVVQRDGTVIEIVSVRENVPIYYAPTNSNAAITTRTVVLYPGRALGLNLTGTGLTMAMWDEGPVRADHVEFGGRVTVRDNGETSSHATHVAGTLIASGVRPDARGMAYNANVLSFDWANDRAEVAREAADGLFLSNHSYGTLTGWHHGDLEDEGPRWYWFGDPQVSTREDYRFGRYSQSASRWDQLVFENQHFLPVISAGNDRVDRGPGVGEQFRGFNENFDWTWYSTVTDFHPDPDGGVTGHNTISDVSLAKNVLTVGAVRQRVNQNDQIVITNFSSMGPADDGRIKPDLVGQGQGLTSPIASSSSAYGTFNGTSMSAPNVSGTLLLLQEHFQNTTGRFMDAATLKGLAVHTASDAGTPGPNYTFGWGLLNAEAAALQISFTAANRLSIVETEIQNGGVLSERAIVTEEGPVKVTISWTDPPSQAFPVLGPQSLNDRRPHLMNDLDLRVVHDESGDVFLPWVLDPENPAAAATRGDNVVDNIEQVFIANTRPGDYTITVSHKNVLRAVDPQPVAIFVTGATDRLRMVAVTNVQAEGTVDFVDLEWQTLFEREEGQFIIERVPIVVGPDGSDLLGEPVVVATIPMVGADDQLTEYHFRDELVPAGRYVYRIIADTETEAPYVERSVTVSVPAPRVFGVLSNYPNPFTDDTRVRVDIPVRIHATVEIFDVMGQRVALLLDQQIPAARQEFHIDTRNWAAGVYFVRITTRETTLVHKMTKIN